MKLLLELLFIGVAVGLICYARVDLGMSWEQMTVKVEHWNGLLWPLVIQLLIAVVAVSGFKFWKARKSS